MKKTTMMQQLLDHPGKLSQLSKKEHLSLKYQTPLLMAKVSKITQAAIRFSGFIKDFRSLDRFVTILRRFFVA